MYKLFISFAFGLARLQLTIRKRHFIFLNKTYSSDFTTTMFIRPYRALYLSVWGYYNQPSTIWWLQLTFFDYYSFSNHYSPILPFSPCPILLGVHVFCLCTRMAAGMTEAKKMKFSLHHLFPFTNLKKCWNDKGWHHNCDSLFLLYWYFKHGSFYAV